MRQFTLTMARDESGGRLVVSATIEGGPEGSTTASEVLTVQELWKLPKVLGGLFQAADGMYAADPKKPQPGDLARWLMQPSLVLVPGPTSAGGVANQVRLPVVPKWVPVEERLPEERANVFILWEGHFVEAFLDEDAGTKVWYDSRTGEPVCRADQRSECGRRLEVPWWCETLTLPRPKP